MIQDNIPSHAISISFDYAGLKGTIHIWPIRIEIRPNDFVASRIAKDSRWQWSALANCGEEATYEDAINQARNWVRGLIKTKTEE